MKAEQAHAAMVFVLSWLYSRELLTRDTHASTPRETRDGSEGHGHTGTWGQGSEEQAAGSEDSL